MAAEEEEGGRKGRVLPEARQSLGDVSVPLMVSSRIRVVGC